MSKTLQELCLDCIVHHPKYRTFEGIIVLFSSSIDLDLPTFAPLKQLVENNIREYFPYLLDKIGLETLQENFPHFDWNKSYQEHLKLEEEKKYLKSMKGTILERQTVVDYVSNFYPYSALKAGVQWPSNVNPAQRETYLKDNEFFEIFQMTKEEFRRQPNFVRKRMKMEKELF